jgi:hypothetical protein
MDAATYALLVFGAVAGGFVSGLAGFGTALMALGIWLYILPPSLAVPLVLICSVVAQTATLPSMWRSFDFTLIWPFVIGGLAGVPIGTMLIAHTDPDIFKLSFGVLLLAFPAALYFQRVPMALRRRQAGGRGDRICGRHPRRSRRPVRPRSDSVGQRARLEQSGAARHLPDLQLDGAISRAVPAGWRRPDRTGGDPAGADRFSGHDPRRLAGDAGLSRAERPEFSRCRARPAVSVRRRSALEQPWLALAAASPPRRGRIKAMRARILIDRANRHPLDRAASDCRRPTPPVFAPTGFHAAIF